MLTKRLVISDGIIHTFLLVCVCYLLLFSPSELCTQNTYIFLLQEAYIHAAYPVSIHLNLHFILPLCIYWWRGRRRSWWWWEEQSTSLTLCSLGLCFYSKHKNDTEFAVNTEYWVKLSSIIFCSYSVFLYVLCRRWRRSEREESVRREGWWCIV